MYWNKTFECMPREELDRVKLDRLQKTHGNKVPPGSRVA